ncbi:Calcium-transporting ATPase [Chlamydia trachomatis]|nr:Calcium-transporting ATPase [Chlamydia trachomatis]CRH46703.1 Calcium-transporting ATPase [Chlamydia trachomatis]CRH55493.1 Calcium-transporting ATPase [Chlamydia trachomatis]CRH56925.1 Calcium-transporting ATPase [Chlamydia trachomatis]
MKKQKIEEYPKIEDNMLEINLKQGLTNEEAINRQKKYGLNELKKTKKINPFLVYLSQFKDVLVIILLCASLLSYIFAIISGSKHN